MNWGNIADAATGGLISFALSDYNRSQQEGAAKRAEQRQIQGAKEMTDYQKNADYDMWRKTGPVGMMEQIKQAGMSPGVMMGKGGIGGGITGGSGAMPSMQQVPDANSATANQINTMMAMSNMKLMEAQTEKTKAEATKIAGTDTKVGEQNIAESKARQALAEINTKYENEALDWKLDKIAQEANIALAEAQIKNSQQEVENNADVIRARRATIIQEATNTAIQASAIESGIRLNEEKIKEISNDITRKWQELNTTISKNRYEHEDRLKTIEEYTKNALKVAGIHAIGNVAGDIVKIATKTPMPKPSHRTNEFPDGGTSTTWYK